MYIHCLFKFRKLSYIRGGAACRCKTVVDAYQLPFSTSMSCRLARWRPSQELYLQRRRSLGFVSSPRFPPLSLVPVPVPMPLLHLWDADGVSPTSCGCSSRRPRTGWQTRFARCPVRCWCYGFDSPFDFATDEVHVVPAAYVADALDDHGDDADEDGAQDYAQVLANCLATWMATASSLSLMKSETK
jgi:hypothetical protein